MRPARRPQAVTRCPKAISTRSKVWRRTSIISSQAVCSRSRGGSTCRRGTRSSSSPPRSRRSTGAARSFAADWFPGIATGEANRFNVLEPSHFEEGTKALLGPERATFIERYKFALEPATDDRPYFFRFFRWGSLREVLSL